MGLAQGLSGRFGASLKQSPLPRPNGAQAGVQRGTLRRLIKDSGEAGRWATVLCPLHGAGCRGDLVAAQHPAR